jgi:hypothetical protein
VSTISMGNAGLLLIFTGWLIGARFKLKPDSSWPFAYYAVLGVFHQAMPGMFSSLPLYIAAVCALFLRFEFMSRTFNILFRVVEAFALLYVMITLVEFISLH